MIFFPLPQTHLLYDIFYYTGNSLGKISDSLDDIPLDKMSENVEAAEAGSAHHAPETDCDLSQPPDAEEGAAPAGGGGRGRGAGEVGGLQPGPEAGAGRGHGNLHRLWLNQTGQPEPAPGVSKLS